MHAIFLLKHRSKVPPTVSFPQNVQGKKEFPSFGITALKLFVLLTGSNNPDVWQPAYEQHRVYR
jgi:hypothetical protein